MTTSEFHQHAGAFTWDNRHGPHQLVDFPSHLSSDLHHYSLSNVHKPTLHFTPVADQAPQRLHISTLKSCKYPSLKRQQHPQEHTPQRPTSSVGTVSGYQHFMNNDRQERSKFVDKLIGKLPFRFFGRPTTRSPCLVQPSAAHQNIYHFSPTRPLG